MPKILLANIHKPNQKHIATYKENGGYKGLTKALEMTPKEVMDEVIKSGLRGRGGAGFPTGRKWSFVPQNTGKQIYLLCNADESEPGTFKDRLLLERGPHMLIEGMIISAYALQCHLSYIYIRGEYAFIVPTLEKAIQEAYDAGYLGPSVMGKDFALDIVIHLAAGAYICGEETGLIRSLQGGRGYPTVKPPFPAVQGFLASPTVVNNVETLAAVPWIIVNGAEAHTKLGTEKSPGTKLFSVSGPVVKQGVFEVELGYPLKKFIYEDCGGIKDGKKLKGVIVGGSSVPILRADEIENVNLDYESLMSAGTFLGSGGMIIIDETGSMPELLATLADFYEHESCGQCTPCREGTGWMAREIHKMLEGKSKPGDIDKLLHITKMIEGNTICALADGAVAPVRSFINKYREEFEALIPKE
ncbi:MAG TPA: NADH-quinone oxidoreductase subunit NuoF [Blastocatellia bacterium]|nr:NADH-quinone oxidoreductase subunit NuoF [Blastocatellia bacterium]